MTREEYNEKSFDELMDFLDGERDDIHTYEDMKVYISEELTIPHGQSDHLSRRFRSLISERNSL